MSCRYMFQYGTRGAYCLGVIDSQWGGLLIGGVATRNVLVKVRDMCSGCACCAVLRCGGTGCAELCCACICTTNQTFSVCCCGHSNALVCHLRQMPQCIMLAGMATCSWYCTVFERLLLLLLMRQEQPPSACTPANLAMPPPPLLLLLRPFHTAVRS